MYDKVTDSYQPNAKIHNSFSLNLVTATYEGLTKLKNDKTAVGEYNYKKRNFIISRGGFAGVHRYAGIWTGDSASSWDFLQINIPEVLNSITIFPWLSIAIIPPSPPRSDSFF